MYAQFEADYDAAIRNFRYTGGAVRLAQEIEDKYAHAREWGHLEKDQFTVPFGPWSKEEGVSGGPWVYRYGTASAATGSRYSVLITRVHADVAAREGGPMIVTVLSPWQASYALAEGGYLDRSYVAEKLTGGRYADGRLHGGDLAAITHLIGILLGRETAA